MDKPTQSLLVSTDAEGSRCDRWLSGALGISRSAAQRLLKEGRVMIDKKPAIPHQPVHGGQRISVSLPAVLEQHRLLPPTVVEETNDFLVLEKPSGLLVHPTPRARETTLTEWLVERMPTIQDVGDPGRPGIVHRIDRDVSGLLVVAKTSDFFSWIQTQFRERHVQKQYTALVIGEVKNDEGLIDFPIARSERRRGRMAARPVGTEGKPARTRYSVRSRFQHGTLLDVEIETGRTHQIRAHFFGIGHPIVGDPLYRAKHPPHLPPLDRPFLHATRLAFLDLDHVLHEYRSPLPALLQQYLDALPQKAV